MSRRILTFIAPVLLASALFFGAGCEQGSGMAVTVSAPAEPIPVRAEPSAAPVSYAGTDAPISAPEPGTVPADGVPAEQAAAPGVTLETAPEPEPEPSAEPERRQYAGPDLAECEPVEDDYFSDAAFFGNSLVDGLDRFGGLGQGSFYAATSASVVNVDVTRGSELENGEQGTLLEAMTEKSHGKIYILLGINEIGFEPDYFAQLYGALIDRIRECEPAADIYIMSLSPVTEKCSQDSDVFNMERIGAYNSRLYALAGEKECYYVDLCQALAGEDGYLPEESSTADGIHLISGEYPRWAQYLRTHTPAPV